MNKKEEEIQNLKTFVRGQGIDLVGIVDLYRLDGVPIGIPAASARFLNNFRYADVLIIWACLGDEGCKVCLVVCPWIKNRKLAQMEVYP